jgi:hypothetical protein
MDKEVTRIREARHVFRLSREELIEAVIAYITTQGETVPEGQISLWGLHHDSYHEPCLSLVVDLREDFNKE